MLGFLNAPMGAAYLIVTTIAHVLTTPLGAGLATAAAIIVFTAAVRLLLSPLSYHAFRGQARISALQPRIAALRARYAHQPDRLQKELTALYRAEGGGMLAGCLPMLLQLPFFSVMYRLFLSRTVDGHANGLLTRDLLTTPLGSHWLTGPARSTCTAWPSWPCSRSWPVPPTWPCGLPGLPHRQPPGRRPPPPPPPPRCSRGSCRTRRSSSPRSSRWRPASTC